MLSDPLVQAVIAVGAVFLILKAALILTRWGRSKAHPYVPADSLLTPAERSFFAVLQEAVGSDYHLFAKVRLADILNPMDGLAGRDWRNALNRITSKHADFVACDPLTFCVVGVIELDDRSHERASSKRNDQFKNEAFAAAQIPILRVPAQRSYCHRSLRDQVKRCFDDS